MEIDRRKFLASVGAGALAVMSHEDRAEALEHYMIEVLDGEDPGPGHGHGHDHVPLGAPRTEDLPEDLLERNGLLRDAAEAEAELEGGGSGAADGAGYPAVGEGHPADDEGHRADGAGHRVQEGLQPPRGTGNLFRPTDRVLEPMPERPTLEDFFRLRFAPANHVLQSATHAMEDGQPEENIMAALLHDVVQDLIKVDHGWWGAQLVEPYVSEYVSWGIRYHAALRFYPDEAYGYEYPELYNRIFGEDYVPPAYIREAADYATGHPLYASARMICVNDTYAFQEGKEVSLDPFIDIIGRHFRTPAAGLGYDNSPVAHMWRTIAMPQNPL